MKVIEGWYDVETSGLDVVDGAAVIQIALMIVEDGKVIVELEYKINPNSYNRDVTISQDALDINGFKVEDFASFETLETVVAKIMHELTIRYPDHKVTLLGYNNSTFDKYFLEDMFKDCEKAFSTYFHWKQIDIFELVKALQFMGVMNKTFNQKLGTIGEYFHIELEGDLHDALTDVKLTRAIYEKIKGKLV